MVPIYAALIEKGLRTIEDVPGTVREMVRQYLRDKGRGELA